MADTNTSKLYGEKILSICHPRIFWTYIMLKTMMLSSFHKHLPPNYVGLTEMCNAFEQLGIANLS
ncbi:hypothetical protein [Nostoc sp. EfeVER01]|uniref:hypothetical protein n=1 Tax=Nostoc sp. EfeVER01 TaxID=3075406 RepID=UPI002AD70773|nr:hypothetical protein [Nostoc sp. EspVER01]